jgi:hypothetical protein
VEEVAFDPSLLPLRFADAAVLLVLLVLLAAVQGVQLHGPVQLQVHAALRALTLDSCFAVEQALDHESGFVVERASDHESGFAVEHASDLG